MKNSKTLSRTRRFPFAHCFVAIDLPMQPTAFLHWQWHSNCNAFDALLFMRVRQKAKGVAN